MLDAEHLLLRPRKLIEGTAIANVCNIDLIHALGWSHAYFVDYCIFVWVPVELQETTEVGEPTEGYKVTPCSCILKYSQGQEMPSEMIIFGEPELN